MRILIASDLHLTDKPDDDYRFGLFDFMQDVIQEDGIQHLFILGDLTDSKDSHSSALVNRTVDCLNAIINPLLDNNPLGSCYDESVVHVLMGNHDFIEKSQPYFLFLNSVDGVSFYRYSQVLELPGNYRIGMLPFCRTIQDFEIGMRDLSRLADTNEYDGLDALDMLFMHQTVHGSRLSNGTLISEEDFGKGLFDKIHCKIYSGDIHVPQEIGNVEYVGSPYAIRFGDTFKGRMIVYDMETKQCKDVYYPCIRKTTLHVNNMNDLIDEVEDLNVGDQVKVKFSIQRKDIADCPALRKGAVDLVSQKGAKLHSVLFNVVEQRKRLRSRGKDDKSYSLASRTPHEMLDKYCKSKKVGKDLHEFAVKVLTP